MVQCITILNCANTNDVLFNSSTVVYYENIVLDPKILMNSGIINQFFAGVGKSSPDTVIYPPLSTCGTPSELSSHISKVPHINTFMESSFLHNIMSMAYEC